MKRWLILIAGLIALFSMPFWCVHITERVTRFELPEGELRWSNWVYIE